jgi:hypothetical protein
VSLCYQGGMDPTDLIRLLLDPYRLAVVGAIATTARSPDEAAAQAGVPDRVALETIAALRQGGAVREDGAGRWQLDPAVLRRVADRLPQPDPPAARIFHGMTAAERKVLAPFFAGERLIRIPSSHGKRLVLLERLALEFEPGRRYDEAEVNAILNRFHDDHASLRRHLVDEGLLDREAGRYWRAGGRVIV